MSGIMISYRNAKIFHTGIVCPQGLNVLTLTVSGIE